LLWRYPADKSCQFTPQLTQMIQHTVIVAAQLCVGR